MRAAASLLFWVTFLSAIYLCAVPQCHQEVGTQGLSRMELEYGQGGEHHRGWPLTYLTYDAEHGRSQGTYFNFTYNYQPIQPVSLVFDIAFFGIALLALFRYPVISANQLWGATALYFAAIGWYYLQVTGSLNQQIQTPFSVRVIGPNQGIHFAIFSVLTVSLFFVIARLVAILSNAINKMKTGNSKSAR